MRGNIFLQTDSSELALLRNVFSCNHYISEASNYHHKYLMIVPSVQTDKNPWTASIQWRFPYGSHCEETRKKERKEYQTPQNAIKIWEFAKKTTTNDILPIAKISSNLCELFKSEKRTFSACIFDYRANEWIYLKVILRIKSRNDIGLFIDCQEMLAWFIICCTIMLHKIPMELHCFEININCAEILRFISSIAFHCFVDKIIWFCICSICSLSIDSCTRTKNERTKRKGERNGGKWNFKGSVANPTKTLATQPTTIFHVIYFLYHVINLFNCSLEIETCRSNQVQG